ncbi:hypothetical protein [Streptomyces sp. PKU-EA00015]|uniref:hypothetical protein n=1 Tax=Streptomyces sp. PKU-EA00015 TaxID=2748326 RepID=UPI002109F9E6|nr:hypothetical protein [Streptomyces sp. PKU-EA00015]
MNGQLGPCSGEGQDGAGADEYSATVLGSHWFTRPESQDAPGTPTAVLGRRTADAAPDRIEGDVLRFGPGVTAAVRRAGDAATAVDVWHGTLAGRPPAGGRARRHGRRLRGWVPFAVVLLAVLAFLAWQYGPGVGVRGVAVRTPAEGPGCDGTADVVGVVRTDGRPGTLTYRWVRSDGTASQPLHEKVARGQKQATLHLLWTFHGRGEYRARAELRIVSPSRHTASARFVYACR